MIWRPSLKLLLENEDIFMETFQLSDGSTVKTGLLVPDSLMTSFPDYSTSAQVLSKEDILMAARSGERKGKNRFDSTWVKNQGNFGSCNGFMVASMLSRARVRRNLERVDLSGAYAYSLMNNGRDQGSTLDNSMRVVELNGIATEETVKFNQIYPYLYDRRKADEEAKQFRAFECYRVKTELELASALILGFDCGVAVHAGARFMQLNPSGIAGADSGPGNHAVGVDGIFAEGDTIFFDMYNSWGVSYGNQGRAYLTWARHLAQTIIYHPFYAIRSTIG